MELWIKISLVLLTLTFSTEGLKCPSCTYLTTDANVPDTARTIIDALLNLFQDPECAKPLTGPIPEIKEEVCAVETNKVSQCSFYKGALSTTLNLFITQVEIPLKVYKRGCFYSLSANAPATGCHDRSAINEDKGVFQRILSSASGQLDAVSFTGELCVCSDPYCKYTSGASRTDVISVGLLIGLLVAVNLL